MDNQVDILSLDVQLSVTDASTVRLPNHSSTTKICCSTLVQSQYFHFTYAPWMIDASKHSALKNIKTAYSALKDIMAEYSSLKDIDAVNKYLSSIQPQICKFLVTIQKPNETFITRLDNDIKYLQPFEVHFLPTAVSIQTDGMLVIRRASSEEIATSVSTKKENVTQEKGKAAEKNSLALEKTFWSKLSIFDTFDLDGTLMPIFNPIILETKTHASELMIHFLNFSFTWSPFALAIQNEDKDLFTFLFSLFARVHIDKE